MVYKLMRNWYLLQCMLGKLSCGTNLNVNSNCQCFGHRLWPYSGQIVKILVQVLSIYRHAQKVMKCQECHKLLRARAWLQSSALCRGLTVPFFRVVNQQPGTSRPTSRSRSSFVAVWMWRASFSWSSLGPLARSITRDIDSQGTVRPRQSAADCGQAGVHVLDTLWLFVHAYWQCPY